MADIRLLREGDEAILANVADDVFDNPVDSELTRQFLADPRHHIAVAIEGGLVIGMATAVHYIHPDKPAELWINEVGVAPSHQRRGIATRLMQAMFAHGRALGCTTAWLGTERHNTAAMGLYTSMNGTIGEADTFFEWAL